MFSDCKGRASQPAQDVHLREADLGPDFRLVARPAPVARRPRSALPSRPRGCG